MSMLDASCLMLDFDRGSRGRRGCGLGDSVLGLGEHATFRLGPIIVDNARHLKEGFQLFPFFNSQINKSL